MPSPPPPEPPRILDDTPVEVAIIGSGVCGVLSAATLRQKDGARVRVFEASPDGAGGVWRTTANSYSTLQVIRVFIFFYPSILFLGRKRERESAARGREVMKKNEGKKSPFLKISLSLSKVILPLFSPPPQQAYAHLYEWDGHKRIDSNPWERAKTESVLSAVRDYARETGVAAATTRGARVTAVTECFTSTSEERKTGNAKSGGFFVHYELDVSAAASEQDRRLRAQGIGLKGGEGAAEEGKEKVIVERRVRAATVLVATGTLGRPMAPEERGLPSTAPFQGIICNACRHEEEWNSDNKKSAAPSSSTSSSASAKSPLTEGAAAVAGKKVVVLGSGAFALEAAERAALCGAESVTIVCRPHEQLRLLFRFLFWLSLSRSRAHALLLLLTPEKNNSKKSNRTSQLGRPLLPSAPLRPPRHGRRPPHLGLRPRPLLRPLLLQSRRHRAPRAVAPRARPSDLPWPVLRRVVFSAEVWPAARDNGEGCGVFGKGGGAGEGGGSRSRHPGRRA